MHTQVHSEAWKSDRCFRRRRRPRSIHRRAEMPVERSIVIAACDEQTLFACRFAKQFQKRPQLLLFLDRPPKHFDLPRKVIRLHQLCRHGFRLLERIV